VNQRNATAVLGVLSAAWPNQDVSEQTATVWMEMLDAVEVEDAMTAARKLVRTSHWFPSIAQFLNETHAEEHARRNRHAARYGLPRNHQTVPPPPRLLAACRELLEEMKGKRHDHHGPAPCPVCGGINPNPKDRKNRETG
jgi:hypothetical protein